MPTCNKMTYAGSMYIDPEPPEYCENDVEEGEEYCPEHQEPEEPDWDTIRKERNL